MNFSALTGLLLPFRSPSSISLSNANELTDERVILDFRSSRHGTLNLLNLGFTVSWLYNYSVLLKCAYVSLISISLLHCL